MALDKTKEVDQLNSVILGWGLILLAFQICKYMYIVYTKLGGQLGGFYIEHSLSIPSRYKMYTITKKQKLGGIK